MEYNKPAKDNEKKIQVVLIIVLVVISVSAAAGLYISYENQDKGPTGPVITVTYSGISVETAYDLTVNNENLLVIDVRTCKCNYNKGHLPNATWTNNPMGYYNTTNDLLIYENNETLSIEFCEQLTNHTYGKLLYLEGGIKAWEESGYPIFKPD
jgi:rhodanese-related sulfurtransferase